MPNTVNISLQEFAFVDSADPASRITGQATQQIVFTRDTAMLMHFQRIDPSLKFLRGFSNREPLFEGVRFFKPIL